MRSSRWHAHGNSYLVTDDGPLTADDVRREVGDADGVLEVLDAGVDSVDIAIWNPDGSRAEMSGNGTRIAARWLGERTDAQVVTVRVGSRSVRATMLDSRLVEQEIGSVVVGRLEEVAGIRLVTVDVGNPHAVVDGEPAELPRLGPLLEVHERFPNRTNVQVARRAGDLIEARVWERGAGETASSGSSAVAVAAAFTTVFGPPAGTAALTVRFPGGDLVVRFDEGRALLTGPAERID
ncbi:MAG: diaminopimelate epimerase [Gaiellaceae bacterium]